jgi:bacterioferritin (cytochrome b1)/uncharacterized protein YjbJ (UPF0337 family)
MAVTKDMLVSELQNPLRLTSFEQTIAAVRRTQAASTPIADELKANYAKSLERSQLISDALRQVGGVPDVVGAAVSKVGAFFTTQLNQVQTLQGALLGDLALEHQLRERARYARTLAESLDYPQLLPVFDRLELAHTATIEWLEARLIEVGRTGTSALKATPVQAAVGAARRVAGAPFLVLAATVNRGTSLLTRGASSAAGTAGRAATTAASGASSAASAAAGTAAEAASTAADAATDLAQAAAGTAAEAASTAADAAATAADRVAGAADTAADTVSQATGTAADTVSGAADTVSEAAGTAAGTVSGAAGTAAEAVSEVAEASTPEVDRVLDLTDVDEDKPPFAGYASLSGDSVMRHVRDSDDVEHLREILAFEQAHKARKGVLGALEDRLIALAGASA